MSVPHISDSRSASSIEDFATIGAAHLDVTDGETLAHLPDTSIHQPLPPGTKIGHLHLQVSALEPARRFYQEQLGFLEHFGLPGLVSNLRTGGAFPHRLAINTFNGTGLPQAPPEMARLRSYTIHYNTRRWLQEVLRRLPEAAETPDGQRHQDPSGNAIALTA
jgi:catechol 2,3-dioxygenase